ncbi:MAG: hypothetical protein VYC38_07450 [Pseudomonadota bacterium]|nr:hypothetical protein [Pseudomonadota bacterium]
MAFVCTYHWIRPSDGSKSYDFKWGTTQQTAVVSFDGLGRAHGIQVEIPFTYHSGHGFKTARVPFGDTPSSCGRHYNIHITDNFMKKVSEDAYKNRQGEDDGYDDFKH